MQRDMTLDRGVPHAVANPSGPPLSNRDVSARPRPLGPSIATETRVTCVNVTQYRWFLLSHQQVRPRYVFSTASWEVSGVDAFYHPELGMPVDSTALPSVPMPDLSIETPLWHRGHRWVAGVDEAGRGCLAGPVVAAAVVLAPDARIDRLDDSKKLTPAARDRIFEAVMTEALAVGIGRGSPAEIDDLNILHASLEAMRRAVLDLALPPDFVLIDGNRTVADAPWPQEAIVKGDARSLSIAAASVVAKVTRDRLMVRLHDDFPEYGWAGHKGYPTAAHYAALRAHGPSPHHRRSFRLT